MHKATKVLNQDLGEISRDPLSKGYTTLQQDPICRPGIPRSLHSKKQTINTLRKELKDFRFSNAKEEDSISDEGALVTLDNGQTDF